MKKWILVVFCLALTSSTAIAAEPVGYDAQRHMHRMEMTKIKNAQREVKKTTPASAQKNAPGFWEKEGERSGLGGGGSKISTFVGSLNPVPFLKDQNAKFKARKAGMAASAPAVAK